MKIAEYGKAAVDAEVMLLKKKSIRISKQVILCLVGALFGLFALISIHAVVAALCLSLLHTGFLGTSLIVFAFDLVCMLLLFLCAFRQRIGEAEIEAKIVRNHNLKELRNSLAITALIGALSGPLGGYLRGFIWQFIKKIFGKS
ncbi:MULTISPECIES: hypothetical protein [Commensalibacter]|uniref:Phage holin family protein n=2 Tax=Commensalibacter TaxID=1079922 RepID=W7DYM0_9PROT|nr:MULTISPECIES: hypothetical protein [Commensalibacter]EUK17789.1 hypothetical protein COMX_07340 [Commensalibacter papalotli (ex Servin-Garciduenas et al. 2014)]CAI3944044.1 unnamed protein product [Commensalibacter papalotli (ex Botero et al. 2024)]CAI3946840.1 unnamed protein product [Commensalibacter papalotli (ex Botero et al. 2024)]